MFRKQKQISNFALYVDGIRSPKAGIDIPINPFSGRVIGRVFISPNDKLLAPLKEEKAEFLNQIDDGEDEITVNVKL